MVLGGLLGEVVKKQGGGLMIQGEGLFIPAHPLHREALQALLERGPNHRGALRPAGGPLPPSLMVLPCRDWRMSLPILEVIMRRCSFSAEGASDELIGVLGSRCQPGFRLSRHGPIQQGIFGAMRLVVGFLSVAGLALSITSMSSGAHASREECSETCGDKVVGDVDLADSAVVAVQGSQPLWNDFSDVQWAKASNLISMWSEKQGPRLLVATNVLVAGLEHRVFAEYSPDHFHPDPWRRPKRSSKTARFLEGYGKSLGQTIEQKGKETRSQGALIAGFCDAEAGSTDDLLIVETLHAWLPGRRVSRLEAPAGIRTVRSLFDSFAVLGPLVTDTVIGVIGVDESDTIIGVHLVNAGEKHFLPFHLAKAGFPKVVSQALSQCNASMELGRTAEGELFVIGFLSTEAHFFSFRFDLNKNLKSIKLESHEALSPYPAHIIGSTSNQGRKSSGDRFFLVREPSGRLFLDDSGPATPEWCVYEFGSGAEQSLVPVFLNVGPNEYDPGTWLYGSTEALGLVTCQDGKLGGVATVLCAAERQRLLMLGLGGSKGVRQAETRRMRIDPFSRGVFSEEHSLLWRTGDRRYMFISPSYTSFLLADLGIPSVGSMSIATMDEMHLEGTAETFLRPLEVFHLEANEYIPVVCLPLE
ncbi:MAG: hypothetical protein GY762_16380 [Proteobacteria bacterium]|nr:hypothetical protein [Pseudomonadota bacterium]